MLNEDTMDFMSNISDIIRPVKNTVRIKNVFGKVGTEFYNPKDWEKRCKRLFDKECKDLKAISNIKNNVDPVIDTLSKLSSSKGRVFVFKNYDMVKHLKLLGYETTLLDKKLGSVPLNDISTYLAYVEEKRTVFICHKVDAGSNMVHHMKNVETYIAYFLTLHSKKIKSTGVQIIGLLIQETETNRKPLQCKFCDLFSPSCKVFESPTSFNNWWNHIETYNNWWDFSKHTESSECSNLFEDLAASIFGFLNQGFVCETTLDNKDIVPSQLNQIDEDSGQLQEFEAQNISNFPHPDHPSSGYNSIEQKRRSEAAEIPKNKDNVFSRNTGTPSYQQQQRNEEHTDNLTRQTFLNAVVQKSLESNNDYHSVSMEDRLLLLLLLLSSLSLHVSMEYRLLLLLVLL